MPPVSVSVPPTSAITTPVHIWKDVVVANPAAPEVHAWFSTYLGLACRLVFMRNESQRVVDPAFGSGIVSFADGYPLLLTSVASLHALNARMEHPVEMTRFRPNIVVTATEPFAEDGWRRIRVGRVSFRVVKPCTRCVVATIDQETAEQGKEPLRTLARFRKRGANVYFGQNLIPEGTGDICVGDALVVLE